MNSKLWVQKTFAMCLLSAIITTGSMVALAGGPVAGELTVLGTTGSDAASVTVNGEPVSNGRTIAASSVISVPEGMTAVVNFGKLGKIEFGSNTTFALNATENGLGGSLTSGSVTVLNAAKGVAVTNLTGETVTANAGETVAANSSAPAQTTKKTSKNAWLAFGIIFAGTVAAIIYAASRGGDSNFSGGATTVSPVR